MRFGDYYCDEDAGAKSAPLDVLFAGGVASISVPRIALRQLSYRECPLFGIALTVIALTVIVTPGR